jgi:hypothetical protein
MFDTISGLPVHALVVHAAVVLLPLMALVTIAFTVRPRWRPGLPWAILGNLVAMGTAYVAAESGGNLQTRLSVQAGQEIAAEHGDLGSVLPNFGIGLVVASVLAYLLVGRTGRARQSAHGWDESGSSRARRPSAVATGLAVLLVVGAGAATTYWTYRVGDSGAKAVWQDTIANTKAP